MKKAKTLVLGLGLSLGVALQGSSARADVITFEASAPGLLAAPIATPTNSVTFGVGADSSPTGSAYVAEVGCPATAFAPCDTPNAADPDAAVGMRFLTDEADGPSATLNYFMTFATPVADLSLHLYDFRVDGGPGIGDQAVLRVFSDLFTTEVGSFTFTIPSPNPANGNVEVLSVLAPSDFILSASLTFEDGEGDENSVGYDVGTGIDNVAFTTVPEPGTLLLLGSGIAALAARRRRQRG